MAGTRTVHRGSRGRFAGASGGRAEKVRISYRGGQAGGRVSPSRSTGRKVTKSSAARNAPRGSTAPRSKPHSTFVSRHKKGLIAGGAVVGVGAAGTIAARHFLPSQKYSTSNKVLSGNLGVAMINGRKVTTYSKGKQDFVTQTFAEGKGLRKKEHTVTIIGNNNKPVGVIYSYRTRFSRTNIVQGTYLTPQMRGKGLGSVGLIAHAAHDPNRMHRASMRRSIQGQAFASKMGGAGHRTSGSKKEGNKITTAMNAEWRANKFEYTASYNGLKAATKGSKIKPVPLKSLKRSRKLRS